MHYVFAFGDGVEVDFDLRLRQDIRRGGHVAKKI